MSCIHKIELLKTCLRLHREIHLQAMGHELVTQMFEEVLISYETHNTTRSAILTADMNVHISKLNRQLSCFPSNITTLIEFHIAVFKIRT